MRRVLLVGNAADRAALRTLIRLAGARVMAAKDSGIALQLLFKFPIDVIVAEPRFMTATGELFETLVRRVGGTNSTAVYIEMPDVPDWPPEDTVRQRVLEYLGRSEVPPPP